MEKGSHIIDPRSGRPVQSSWQPGRWRRTGPAPMPSSTAFMVMTPEEVAEYCREYSDVRGLLIVHGDGAAGQAERIVPVGKWEAGELVG